MNKTLLMHLKPFSFLLVFTVFFKFLRIKSLLKEVVITGLHYFHFYWILYDVLELLLLSVFFEPIVLFPYYYFDDKRHLVIVEPIIFSQSSMKAWTMIKKSEHDIDNCPGAGEEP